MIKEKLAEAVSSWRIRDTVSQKSNQSQLNSWRCQSKICAKISAELSLVPGRELCQRYQSESTFKTWQPPKLKVTRFCNHSHAHSFNFTGVFQGFRAPRTSRPKIHFVIVLRKMFRLSIVFLETDFKKALSYRFKIPKLTLKTRLKFKCRLEFSLMILCLKFR